MLWEVERLLNETENLPQILLMENVPQVISADNIDDFHSWCKFLESKGYKCYTQVLNAKDYGVAQNRERCFMVSILGNYNYKFPQPVPLDKTMKDYLEDEVDERYYINSEKAQKLIKDLRESGQLDGISKTVRGGQNSMQHNDISEDKEIDVAKVGQVSTDGSQCGSVYSDDGNAPTLTAGTHGDANSKVCTEYRIRKLTPKECWRLMDFSDEDFHKAEKVNSNTQLYKQAGNSIVVNVLVAILGQLFSGKEDVYKNCKVKAER